MLIASSFACNPSGIDVVSKKKFYSFFAPSQPGHLSRQADAVKKYKYLKINRPLIFNTYHNIPHSLIQTPAASSMKCFLPPTETLEDVCDHNGQESVSEKKKKLLVLSYILHTLSDLNKISALSVPYLEGLPSQQNSPSFKQCLHLVQCSLWNMVVSVTHGNSGSLRKDWHALQVVQAAKSLPLQSPQATSDTWGCVAGKPAVNAL